MNAYDAGASSEESEDGVRMSPVPFLMPKEQAFLLSRRGKCYISNSHEPATGDFDTSNPSADRRCQMPTYTPVILKTRSRTAVQVNLFPSPLKEGYLPPIEH